MDSRSGTTFDAFYHPRLGEKAMHESFPIPNSFGTTMRPWHVLLLQEKVVLSRVMLAVLLHPRHLLLFSQMLCCLSWLCVLQSGGWG